MKEWRNDGVWLTENVTICLIVLSLSRWYSKLKYYDCQNEVSVRNLIHFHVIQMQIKISFLRWFQIVEKKLCLFNFICIMCVKQNHDERPTRQTRGWTAGTAMNFKTVWKCSKKKTNVNFMHIREVHVPSNIGFHRILPESLTSHI